MSSNPQESAFCPYDRQPILSTDRTTICPGCRRVYHKECWDELGGCAVYGCIWMVEVKKPREAMPTFWGNPEKICPVCAEKIRVADLQCPYCRTVFNDFKPVSRQSMLPRVQDPRMKALRTTAVWLLVFSLLGITSPIALLAGSVWYSNRKAEIERAGGTTKAITLIALGACIIYAVAIALGLVVFLISGQQKA